MSSTPLEMAELYDVVVIGAGISGLTTAYRLKKKDCDLRVVVLEAKDRVGGRTQTVKLKTQSGTDWWDLGGQWVGRCQPHIISLLLELGLETYPQYSKGKKLQQLAGPTISSYSGDLPSLSVFALIDLYRFLSKVESLRKTVNPADPFACPMAEKWDSITFGHFVQENCYTQGAIDAILASNRTIYGMETTQISFLFWLMYTSAADGILKICECKEFTAQESTIKGGAQQVSERLAKEIGRENVLLGHPVTVIQQDGDCVNVTTVNDQQFAARLAVLAIPPPLMDMIQFSPPLPEIKKQLCKKMLLGNYIKVIITYQEAFWRRAGYSGEVVTNGGMTAVPNCSSGPLSIVYDACLASGSCALIAFIAGDVKVEWTEQSVDVRRRAVLDQLADYFGQDVYSCLDYVEKDWNQEPFSFGGPVCTVPPGSMPLFVKAIRKPFKRLHFAGTETATAWCGYMNGAVQAGLRAAAEILEILRPQALNSEDIWALEETRLITKPSRGLSKARWNLQPRKACYSVSFLKWVLGVCVLSGMLYFTKKNRLTKFLPRTQVF